MSTTEMQKTVCPDCGVEPGQQHEEGCDVARCVLCGAQDLGCGYHDDEDDLVRCSNTHEPLPAETMEKWTGVWPGIVECREFGWYSRWTEFSGYDNSDGIPDTGPSVPCAADHPHAHEDLNRLNLAGLTGELRWDRDRQRWVKL